MQLENKFNAAASDVRIARPHHGHSGGAHRVDNDDQQGKGKKAKRVCCGNGCCSTGAAKKFSTQFAQFAHKFHHNNDGDKKNNTNITV